MDRQEETVLIEPCYQTEGKGRVSIVKENGNVKNVYFQALDYRGFERLLEGRLIEELPRIVTRICGGSSFSHQIASAKAVEDILGINVTKAGKTLRELSLCTSTLYYHFHHLFFKVLPRLRSSNREVPMKNVIEILQKQSETSRNALKRQAELAKTLEIVGGKALHPTLAVPGGVSKTLTEREKEKIRESINEILQFTLDSLHSFKKNFIENGKYEDLYFRDFSMLKTYHMGLIDEEDLTNFYDGNLKIIDSTGTEFMTFSPSKYLDHIAEKSQPWSYAKFPYLKDVGVESFKRGEDSGVYRVGSLSRLNVTKRMPTKKAQTEYKDFIETVGTPAGREIAFYWSRLIEMVYCSERILELLENPATMEGIPRNYADEYEGTSGDTGVGVTEASQGVLIHQYEVNQEGKVSEANLVPPSAMNNLAMSIEIKKSIDALVKHGELSEKAQNRIERICMAYNPCIPDSTH